MEKKRKVSHKLIIVLTFIVIVALVTTVLIYAEKSKADTVAKAVLIKAYGAKLQDYDDLTKALVQSSGDNKIILDYMHTFYGEQLTENGCEVFLNNRITSAFTAHEENSNLLVSFIKLEPEDALSGSKNFIFNMQVRTEKEPSKTFTYKGHIRLIQENGQWKVDGVSPRS